MATIYDFCLGVYENKFGEFKFYLKENQIGIAHTDLCKAVKGLPSAARRIICENKKLNTFRADSLNKGNQGYNNCIIRTELRKYIDYFSKLSDIENAELELDLLKQFEKFNRIFLVKRNFEYALMELYDLYQNKEFIHYLVDTKLPYKLKEKVNGNDL